VSAAGRWCRYRLRLLLSGCPRGCAPQDRSSRSIRWKAHASSISLSQWRCSRSAPGFPWPGLRRRIGSGQYRPDTRIPTESERVEEFEVAHRTRHLRASSGAYGPGGGGRGTPVALAAQVTLIARLGRRTRVGAVITKDLYTYTIIILRQDKSLRDHGRAAVCRVIGVHRDKGDTCPLACGPGPAVASVESALRHRLSARAAAHASPQWCPRGTRNLRTPLRSSWLRSSRPARALGDERSRSGPPPEP
jgi:hypothetical protein